MKFKIFTTNISGNHPAEPKDASVLEEKMNEWIKQTTVQLSDEGLIRPPQITHIVSSAVGTQIVVIVGYG